MAIIFIRASITYTVLLIVIRFMGKRQIGEMQPFEFVLTLLIADLACIPMSDTSIPLGYGISAIIAIFIIHQFMSIFEQFGEIPKILLSGKPSIVINKNGVNFKELKKNNLDVSDLIESMRGLGYFSLDSVDYAIYESSGTLSAVEKENAPPNELPILIINDGKIIKGNLKICKIDQKFIVDFLKNKNVNDVKKVGVLTISGSGRFYLQKYNSKYLVGNLTLPKGVIW